MDGNSVAVISSYPPTRSGTANYAFSLTNTWNRERPRKYVHALRLTDEIDNTSDCGCISRHLDPSDPTSIAVCARQLDRFSCVLIQHDFDSFGPDDGIAVFDLVDRLESPLIVTFHSVPEHPVDRRRRIIERLLEVAGAGIVLSRSAEDRLRAGYEIGDTPISVVPEGAQLMGVGNHPPTDPPELLTWGILGPGKGIERAIRAVGLLADLGVTYRIVGPTNPSLVGAEVYREGLEQLVEELGLRSKVTFDPGFADVPSLAVFLSRASVALVPYDPAGQTSSGVLTEAVAAQLPAVATGFPYATELAAEGAVVVSSDTGPEALAAAVRALITDDAARATMLGAQGALGARMHWSAVAHQVEQVLDGVLGNRPLVRS
jgi:glycosyltransferase involved in cell wall biosynthesis